APERGGDGLEDEPRHREPAPRELPQRRHHEQLRLEGVLPRLLPYHRADELRRRDAVGEAGADEGAGRDAHDDRDRVEVDAVEGVVEGAEGADLVDRPLGPAPGEGEADDSGATGIAALHGGYCVKYVIT